MNLFSIHNVSKTFEETLLFQDISFGMESGERVGIIGRNGVGKSTLLRIIAGKEVTDTGTVAYNKNVTIEYLEQLPSFTEHAQVLNAVMSGKPEEYGLIKRHHTLCHIDTLTTEQEAELHDVSERIAGLNAWNLENEAKRLISMLGVTTFDADVRNLSGGQRKRVALARALLSAPDLLILDEPTNHLDAATVQWLQEELQQSTKSVLLVTHDRYFLDAVSNKIIELDKNKLYVFPGSYEKYLERKEQMVQTEEAAAEHLRNKIRSELAWLQKGAKARRTKQQSRINWIEKMTAEPEQQEQREIKIEVGNVFLGGRIIDAYNISKSINGRILFNKFTYNAAPGDKIGIIGPNGTGKSTLLNTLVGLIEPETGSVKLGDLVKIGYFRQEFEQLPPMQTLIGAVRDVAEYIDAGVGRERYISARELLERFLFAPNRHHSRVETLSGGERRRLELCRILMGNPNVLILDEPTNDFDLATLSALEEYLQYFKGVLIIVSHDRAFLDKTVEFVYAFEENGNIKQYPGNYSSYLDAIEAKKNQPQPENKTIVKEVADRPKQVKKGLSFKEQREYELLETQILQLEEQKVDLENQLNNAQNLPCQTITELSEKLSDVGNALDVSTLRWLELDEKKSV
ncbi:MAG: ABC-F family ATP-binding cassette domain-containing protein [Bacteriodetes bacterium]|nr:ABC-F family ATP-binding cassette domain-containing protein [Bacteroidota bacterium]